MSKKFDCLSSLYYTAGFFVEGFRNGIYSERDVKNLVTSQLEDRSAFLTPVDLARLVAYCSAEAAQIGIELPLPRRGYKTPRGLQAWAVKVHAIVAPLFLAERDLVWAAEDKARAEQEEREKAKSKSEEAPSADLPLGSGCTGEDCDCEGLEAFSDGSVRHLGEEGCPPCKNCKATGIETRDGLCVACHNQEIKDSYRAEELAFTEAVEPEANSSFNVKKEAPEIPQTAPIAPELIPPLAMLGLVPQSPETAAQAVRRAWYKLAINSTEPVTPATIFRVSVLKIQRETGYQKEFIEQVCKEGRLGFISETEEISGRKRPDELEEEPRKFLDCIFLECDLDQVEGSVYCEGHKAQEEAWAAEEEAARLSRKEENSGGAELIHYEGPAFSLPLYDENRSGAGEGGL